jgi:hypothetical protein
VKSSQVYKSEKAAAQGTNARKTRTALWISNPIGGLELQEILGELELELELGDAIIDTCNADFFLISLSSPFSPQGSRPGLGVGAPFTMRKEGCTSLGVPRAVGR